MFTLFMVANLTYTFYQLHPRSRSTILAIIETQEESKLRESIVSQDTSSIKAGFKNKLNKKFDYPLDPNWWVGLAIVLSQQSMEIEKWDLERLEVAIDIHYYLGNDSSLNSAMLLRVSAINKFGSFSTSEAEDIQEINNYFFGRLNLSLAEAEHKVNLFQEGLSNGDIYKHLSNDELLELRKIKGSLNIIQELSEDWISRLNPIIND
jgi:hypothetical protein